MPAAPRSGGGSPSPAAYLPNNPVDVDDAVTEGGEQVLAVGGDVIERATVDQGGVDEPAHYGLDTSITRPRTGNAGTAPGGAACGPPALHARCAADAGGSAAAAKPPRASAVMAWAWPNPESNGDDVDTCMPGRQPLGPRQPERDPRRRPSAGRRWSTCRSPCDRRAVPNAARRQHLRGCRRGRTATPRPAGGSAVAHRRPSCRTRQPARRRAWPSPGTACAGTPPGSQLGQVALAQVEPETAVCRLMPVIGSTSHDPKPRRVRLDQADSRAARVEAVHRYVVSPGVAAAR